MLMFMGHGAGFGMGNIPSREISIYESPKNSVILFLKKRDVTTYNFQIYLTMNPVLTESCCKIT